MSPHAKSGAPRRVAPETLARLSFSRLELDQVAVDLTQGDGQRLLLRRCLDQRANVLEQTLTELPVVGVDLPGPLRRDDDERVLGLRALEQLVDRRVGNAFGRGHGCGHVSAFLSVRLIVFGAFSLDQRYQLRG